MSTGCPGLIIVYVAVTGLIVPEENAGMFTFAFTALTTVKPCSPIPELKAASTVTEFGPAVIASNAPRLPCETSVTVSVGVQTFGSGVGDGVGVGWLPGA